MCGRFTLRTPAHRLAEFFRLIDSFDWKPRYNIAPTQPVLIIRDEEGRRQPAVVRWGLIPSWADDERIGSRMINARAETAATKPSFRSAFRRRRCLVPADGFFEWKKLSGRGKQPYYITRPDGTPFALAGLWERWEKGPNGPIESCTILTTAANQQLAQLHDRMPVILPEEAFDIWLDPELADPEALKTWLKPAPDDLLEAYPVRTIVNSPTNDRPECIEPVEPAE